MNKSTEVSAQHDLVGAPGPTHTHTHTVCQLVCLNSQPVMLRRNCSRCHSPAEVLSMVIISATGDLSSSRCCTIMKPLCLYRQELTSSGGVLRLLVRCRYRRRPRLASDAVRRALAMSYPPARGELSLPLARPPEVCRQRRAVCKSPSSRALLNVSRFMSSHNGSVSAQGNTGFRDNQ